MSDITHPSIALFYPPLPSSPFGIPYPSGILLFSKEKCHFEERGFHVSVCKSCDRPHCDDGYLRAG